MIGGLQGESTANFGSIYDLLENGDDDDDDNDDVVIQHRCRVYASVY